MALLEGRQREGIRRFAVVDSEDYGMWERQ